MALRILKKGRQLSPSMILDNRSFFNCFPFGVSSVSLLLDKYSIWFVCFCKKDLVRNFFSCKCSSNGFRKASSFFSITRRMCTSMSADKPFRSSCEQLLVLKEGHSLLKLNFLMRL